MDDRDLQEILEIYIKDLTLALSNLINIFEPEVISIGGSFAHYEDTLLKKLKEELSKKTEVFNKGELPNIVIAKLKNDAGIIGAAMMI